MLSSWSRSLDRSEALRLLSEGNARERLSSARFLSRAARPEDADALEAARRREPDVWTRSALDRALRALRGDPTRISGSVDAAYGEVDERQALAEVYAEAVEETTQRIVHELKRVVGFARYYAKKELTDFDASRTKRELDRLVALMDAVERLGRASAAPAFDEFNLGALIADVAEAEVNGHDVDVELIGPQPFLVRGDAELLTLVVRNGIANAVEATVAVDDASSRPISVNWNATDTDYWLSILDRGCGLPPQRDLFELAVTTKSDHFGMGLTLAYRATLSLRGTLTLESRDGGITAYEMRWPTPTEPES
jgi:signal transduction histidine kinase